MYRHIRRGAAGFSMVELLVTIVIAAIAFAAMVPVFVSATQKASGDTFRNVATQTAQDRIELIRQLAYDQITDANLNSDNFPTTGANLFSQTVPYYGGSSSAMTFHLLTQVALVPSTATLGSEQFKTVTVTAWWGPEANLANVGPSVKPTKLQTQIYKQYAGPTISTFSVATLVPKSAYGADLVWITAMPLTLQVTIPEIDRPVTSLVHFSIRDASSEVANKDVSTPSAPGTYKWVYSGPMDDGLYTVYAQAKSTKNFDGNLVSLPVTVEQGPPPKPLNVEATAGSGSVSVTWNASTAADFDHFEVYRSSTGDAGSYTLRGTTPGNVSPSYRDIDASLQVGQTYYYIVYAVDKMGTALEAKGITDYRSDPSDAASVLMVDMTDKNAPPVPAWVGAPFTPSALSVTLVWTKTIDAAPPSIPSGTKEFIVTRQSSTDGGTIWGLPTQLPPVAFNPSPLVTTQSTSDGTLAYGTRYRYEVSATDVSGNASVNSDPTIVTVPPQTRTLTVNNSQNGTDKYVYVYVTSTTNLLYYNQDGSLVADATAAKVTVDPRGSKSWSLSVGDYNVHYSTSGTIPFGNNVSAPSGTPQVTVP